MIWSDLLTTTQSIVKLRIQRNTSGRGRKIVNYGIMKNLWNKGFVFSFVPR